MAEQDEVGRDLQSHTKLIDNKARRGSIDAVRCRRLCISRDNIGNADESTIDIDDEEQVN